MAADLIVVSGWIKWLGARSWVQCLGLIVAAFDPGRIVSWRLGWRNRRSSALSSYGLGVLILLCDGQGGWLVVVSQGWWRRCAKNSNYINSSSSPGITTVNLHHHHKLRRPQIDVVSRTATSSAAPSTPARTRISLSSHCEPPDSILVAPPSPTLLSSTHSPHGLSSSADNSPSPPANKLLLSPNPAKPSHHTHFDHRPIHR
ncbi:hypothetical protein M0R45_006323 [Rubus argutus]|uniref:Uncharacterized protein n=1 Tax=Rubus argutus TaxID=59490 RepID=A0AAW1YQM9_RUBAR